MNKVSKKCSHRRTRKTEIARGIDSDGDMYIIQESTCKKCGHVGRSTLYPNLLSDVFSG